MTNESNLITQVTAALTGAAALGAVMWKLALYYSNSKRMRKPEFTADATMNAIIVEKFAEINAVTKLYHEALGRIVFLNFENGVLKKWARQAILIFRKQNIEYPPLGDMLREKDENQK